MKKIFFILFVLPLALNFSFAQSDTVTTSSGLKYIVIKEGKGKEAKVGQAVEVHYTGTLVDGKKFDSSRDRGVPIEFTLGEGQVIKGWDEGIALMRVGGKMKLIIPPELAYGSRAVGDLIPANSTLIFDVELVSVHKPKISIVDTLMTVILDKNVKTAVDVYYNLKDEYEDKYNFKESELNMLGYRLLQTGHVKDAIEIFKINVEQFPESFNVYDSLGEGYMVDGNTKLAIKNYEKSIEINPENDNGKKMLEKLKEKK
jgi:FKBP-type peptidyl-prolyl cis-trans isomerase 2